MAEVVGKKTSSLTLLTLTLLTLGGSGVYAQRENINQDPLPSRSKFSAQLKEQNIAFPVKVMELPAAPPTRDPSLPRSTSSPPDSVTEELSLWEMMKHNFNQGLNFKSEEPKPEDSNSVYAPVKSSHLSSSWDWASKLGSSPSTKQSTILKLNDTGDRSTRDAGWGWGSNNHQTLAWDTAKIVGNVGKGLLSSWWTKSIVVPNLLAWPLQSLVGSGGSGWGKTASKVVLVHDTSLLERWIRAKFSITQHLLLAKLRLTKNLITSTIPGTIRLKLNLINTLLHYISQTDPSKFFKTYNLIRKTIWNGKRNLWWKLINVKTIAPVTGYGYEVEVETPKPIIHYGSPSAPSQPWVGKLPEVHYSKPIVHYGDVSAPNYGTNGQQETIVSYHPSKPNYGVQQPSPQPWTSSLKNPLYAFPSSYEDAKHESQYADYAGHIVKSEDYATLPPVVVPQPAYSFGSPENVVVSSKFLRDLMRQSRLSGKGDEDKMTQPETGSSSVEEAEGTKRNKFSDQLKTLSG